MRRRQLEEDALEKKVEREKYDEFCQRVKDTIMSTSVEYISKTIESMPDRRKNEGSDQTEGYSAGT